jgi:phage head maturation protease
MDNFNIVFPFQKIDKEKRIVKGIATADNVDQEDELVDFEASKRAFANWIGNIREMHEPVAVGTAVDWTTVPVYYKGDIYQGIEVSAYISKGAQDTWEKILDGTLRGFSIGGAALEKEKVWKEDLQKSVTCIKEYALGELSLVDNPCNPAGMFTMIKKLSDGSLTSVSARKPVYYCIEHKYASMGDNNVCVICSKEMTEVGFTEDFNSEVITKMVTKFEKGGSKVMDLHENIKNDSIPDMDNLTDTQKDSVVEKLKKMLFGSDEETAIQAITPNVTINISKGILDDTKEETSDDAEDAIEKSIESVDTDVDNKEEDEMNIDEILEKFTSVLDSKLDEKLEKVKSDISEEVDAKIEKSVSEVKETASESIDELTEEVKKIADSGAIKKSVDTDDDESDEVDDDIIEKSATKSDSFWGGAFLPEGVAEVLGYES